MTHAGYALSGLSARLHLSGVSPEVTVKVSRTHVGRRPAQAVTWCYPIIGWTCTDGVGEPPSFRWLPEGGLRV